MLQLQISNKCTVLESIQVKISVIEVIKCDQVQEVLSITLVDKIELFSCFLDETFFSVSLRESHVKM